MAVGWWIGMVDGGWNPADRAGFDIIGFFINMIDEKRIMLLLGTLMIMIGLNTLNKRR